PEKDTYTLVAETSLPRITAIRLDAIADPSLEGGGPGRASKGNFALSDISLKAGAASDGGGAVALKLINPQADFEQAKYPVAAALDGNPGTAWSTGPLVGKDHQAYFELDASQKSAFPKGSTLTFTLDFQD